MATQGIGSDPRVMMGKPVVEGTRITVELILEELGAGQTIKQLAGAHPWLTREGVLAAVRLGAEVLRADVVYDEKLEAAPEEIEAGYAIRPFQEQLGQEDVSATAISTRVLDRGGRGVRSPIDGL